MSPLPWVRFTEHFDKAEWIPPFSVFCSRRSSGHAELILIDALGRWDSPPRQVFPSERLAKLHALDWLAAVAFPPFEVSLDDAKALGLIG